jgi:predicted RNA binding protein YcfA (HicA-like mRNA interferase family)
MAGLNVSSKQFGKILERNNFELNRYSGDHLVYKHRTSGAVISVPHHLNPIIAQRLTKEFKLNVSKK